VSVITTMVPSERYKCDACGYETDYKDVLYRCAGKDFCNHCMGAFHEWVRKNPRYAEFVEEFCTVMNGGE